MRSGTSRDGLAQSDLILHVVRKVRERVALRLSALVGDFFVAAGKGNRLEAQERNDLRIVEREADHRAHLLVVDAVNNRDDRYDFHAGIVKVVDRLELDVEEIADQAMRVGFVSDAIELQIGIAQTGFGRLLAELRALGELDAIGRRLNAVVSDLAA